MLVPDGACVSTRGSIGLGEADMPQGGDEGFNVPLVYTPELAGRPELVLDADIGLGHLKIDQFGGVCA